jgi:CRP/FNR family transcriptional regulator, cyclic AMP receptor protein
LIDRFLSSGGDVLKDALLSQRLVIGDVQLADAIAKLCTLSEVCPGTPIIIQGNADTDVHLILSGNFMVVVNGRNWRLRGPGDHVGEMAAIEPSQARSASVVATEPGVIATLTQRQFLDLTDRFPNMWRVMAKELSRRLNQRNAHISPVNHTPTIFIASSSESRDVATSLKDCFANDPFNVILWTEGVFEPSGYPLDSLDDVLSRSDFAVVIAAPDDIVSTRGRRHRAPRDNVTFELGLAIGKLSRKRSLLLEVRTSKVTLASDLLGLTTIPYERDPDKRGAKDLAVAAQQIRAVVLDLGPA